MVTVQLRVLEGQITVTTCNELGVSTWQNSLADGPKEDVVFMISGSWNAWGFDIMRKADLRCPKVCRHVRHRVERMRSLCSSAVFLMSHSKCQVRLVPGQ